MNAAARSISKRSPLFPGLLRKCDAVLKARRIQNPRSYEEMLRTPRSDSRNDRLSCTVSEPDWLPIEERIGDKLGLCRGDWRAVFSAGRSLLEKRACAAVNHYIYGEEDVFILSNNIDFWHCQ